MNEAEQLSDALLGLIRVRVKLDGYLELPYVRPLVHTELLRRGVPFVNEGLAPSRGRLFSWREPGVPEGIVFVYAPEETARSVEQEIWLHSAQHGEILVTEYVLAPEERCITREVVSRIHASEGRIMMMEKGVPFLHESHGQASQARNP